jgi:hypothetical protein
LNDINLDRFGAELVSAGAYHHRMLLHQRASNPFNYSHPERPLL